MNLTEGSWTTDQVGLAISLGAGFDYNVLV